jgi:HSP20 family protein
LDLPMIAIRHEPWAALDQLQGQLYRLFDQERERTGAGVSIADWIPAADVEEHPDKFVLKLDVPGVDLSAIEITLDRGVLSVSGTRARDEEKADVRRRRTERQHGRFHRRFTLPETVDAAAVHATGRNGILEITIPKKPKPEPRRIQVAAA